MGIRGLTTFIAHRSQDYFQPYELHDTQIVIDGNSLACQLYSQNKQCYDCFGGDYDKYSHMLVQFFQNLLECNIRPLIVIDGGYEKRKMKTVIHRMKQRITNSCRLNSTNDRYNSVFPLFFFEVFVDVIQKMNLRCAQTEFEADAEIASLARALNCPVLSFDSDFYIFDILYVPIPYLDPRVHRRNNVKFLSCRLYTVDRFLDSFGGLDKANLPLLAALLGNDYIKKSTFRHFYDHIKLVQMGSQNEQQRNIKTVISWLRHETPESALVKILARYKLNARKRIANRIEQVIKGYQLNCTELFDYFTVSKPTNNLPTIKVPNPEEVQADDNATDCTSDVEEEEEEEEMFVEEVEVEDSTRLPKFFLKKFRECLFPPTFMNLIHSKRCFFMAQVDDYQQEHCHKICLRILSAIYQILTKPETQQLSYVSRQNETLKTFYMESVTFDFELPSLYKTPQLLKQDAEKIFMKILKLDLDLTDFPPNWHLYIIGMNYLLENSKNSITIEFIYSLMLCAIILNCVDNKIGYFRSLRKITSRYPTPVTKADDTTGSIKELLKKTDYNNALSCMLVSVDYFEMDDKLQNQVKLFDRKIVHIFAELQSCLLQIRHLNALLGFPFPQLCMANFFDGTFLYNMTVNLMGRRNTKEYLKNFLDKCPTVYNLLEMLVAQFENNAFIVEKRSKRKKKKKKKAKLASEESDDAGLASDWEEMVDPNNIYSVLSVLNR